MLICWNEFLKIPLSNRKWWRGQLITLLPLFRKKLFHSKPTETVTKLEVCLNRLQETLLDNLNIFAKNFKKKLVVCMENERIHISVQSDKLWNDNKNYYQWQICGNFYSLK